MDMSWLGSAIGAAAGHIDSIAGHFAEKKRIKLQNDLNMQSWLMQQQYNSPAAQASRFEAAGFNRNLAMADNGNASQPLQQMAPDYSHSLGIAAAANQNAARSFGDKVWQAQQREMDRELTRSAQKLEQQRIDNARSQLELNRMLANMYIRKGNLVSAGLALDNNYKARTLSSRVDHQYNLAGISGNNYILTSYAANTAPEFYQLRNQNLASQIAYRKAMASLGFGRLNENKRQFDLNFGLSQKRYNLDFSKYSYKRVLDWELYQLAADRVHALQGQLQVAKDAEERKQIEQRLNYATKWMEDILKYAIPIPSAPRTITTKSPMGTTTKSIY